MPDATPRARSSKPRSARSRGRRTAAARRDAPATPAATPAPASRSKAAPATPAARGSRRPAAAPARVLRGAATPAKAVATPAARSRTSAARARGAALAARSASASSAVSAASALIDQRLRELSGWRGQTLARLRALILAVDPKIAEEWKWNTPVWSLHGIVCTGEAYKQVVKLTFARGASVSDPSRLFNSSLQGNTRRAIDLREGETIDARAFQALVAAAIAVNSAASATRAPAR